MEDAYDAAALKAESLNRVPRAARWYPYRLLILMEFSGALTLFALYLTIVTVAQGWPHAVELFWQDAWLVIPNQEGPRSFPQLRNRGQVLTLTLHDIATIPNAHLPGR